MTNVVDRSKKRGERSEQMKTSRRSVNNGERLMIYASYLRKSHRQSLLMIPTTRSSHALLSTMSFRLSKAKRPVVVPLRGTFAVSAKRTRKTGTANGAVNVMIGVRIASVTVTGTGTGVSARVHVVAAGHVLLR